MAKRKRENSGEMKNVEETTVCEDVKAFIQRVEKSNESPLIVAIKENNTRIFRELLNSGHKLNTKLINKPMTPLHFAIQNGNLEIVQLLFDNGYSKLKVRKGNKEIPLFLAVANGHVEIVKYLIEKGHKEDLLTQDNHILVRKCIENDRLDIVKCLIDNSDGINEENLTSETLIHHAASHGRLDIVKYLIETGANVQVKTDHNETPLHYAIRGQHVEVVRELLKLCEVKVPTYATLFSDMAVHLAAEVGNEEIFNMLLEAGYSKNGILKKRTPIHVAAEFGHWKLIDSLIKAGVHIDSLTKNKETPLFFAIASGDLSTVKFLLDAGACPVEYKTISMYESLHIRCILSREMWKSQIPLKLMIDRQVKILRCLLNHIPEENFRECITCALTTTFTQKTPTQLLYVLLEHFDSVDRMLTKHYDDVKSLAAIVDHTVLLKTLLSPIKYMSEYDLFRNNDSVKDRIFREIVVARVAVILSVSEDSNVENDLKIDKYNVNDWYEECKKQIMIMKETKIDEDFDVTFYDILTKPIDNVANFLRCEKLVTNLESSYDKFSAYSALLETRVEKGQQRKMLIDTSVNCLFNIIERNHKIQLPSLVIMKIFESLAAVDLRKLIEVCS